MKTIYLHILFLFFLLLTACTDKEVVSTSASQLGQGCQFSVSIPTPMEANTRAIGSELTESYVKSLPMHVLVFDENGFFFAFQEATVESFTANENGAGGVGTYTVNLPASNTPCALHFVLGNVDDFENPQYTASDSETSIFSQLETSNDVYWQRVEVDNILKDENGQVTSLPETIKLVRNYAQVSVDVTGDAVSVLTLKGFAVLNNIDRGTVAPFTGNEDNLFASFDIDEEGEGTDYEKFVASNQGFGGCNPPQGNLNQEVPEIFDAKSKYVYERNQDEGQYPAYVLVKAEYTDNDGTHECYYKLDIVSFDEDTYVTSYLNLYRNFHYTIHIKSVSGIGYKTPKEAMDAVASNNISASVEVSQVNRIEDGLGNSLSVEELDIMIVSNEEYELDYTYIHANEEHNESPDYVQVIPVGGNDGGGYNHKAVKEIRCDGNGKIIIVPAETLPDVIETQEFIVAGKSGLSRRVRVNVREKFRFDVVDCDERIEGKIGERQILRVRLPQNMPSSVFPLVLTIEPKRKTLYPDVSQNRIPVNSSQNYTFTYDATVVYSGDNGEGYINNPTQSFVFLTNVADNETFITVTNPYFVNESIGFDYDWQTADSDMPYNVTRFWNGDRYNFFNVSLNREKEEQENGTWTQAENPNEMVNKGTFEFTDTDYDTYGHKVTLRFTMHHDGDTYDTPHPVVEIYGDHFNWDDIEHPKGSYTLRDDGQCILYSPNDPTEEQSITFTINKHYARDDIQLSSYDHETAFVTYTNHDHTVRFQYQSGYRASDVPQGNNNLYVSTNRNFSDAEYWEVGSNGNVVINPYIIGLSPDTRLYFRYRRYGFNYEDDMTVQELLETANVTLE